MIEPTAEAPRERNIVLVVDDSPDALRMLTDALEQSGATVLVALEGSQALEIAGHITPDIILMDAMMPGMDGFETTRRLKADPSLSHVPVIFMTGLSETEHVVRGFEAGGVDYVTKPLVPQELLARVRVHLANARATESARAALDTAGRYLLAVNPLGRLLWCTPQARRRLDEAFPGGLASARLEQTLSSNGADGSPGPEAIMPSDNGAFAIRLTFLGKVGDDEHLYRLSGAQTAREEDILARQFGLTPRESDVLLWIAKGKSNRDIAEILLLSPRTVNKHLESVFAKLGVESRAAAAVQAVRALSEPN